MKKKVLGLALIAMSFVAFNGMAQNNSAKTAKQENAKCAKAGECGKKQCKMNPFEGINLTEAQQNQLKQLNDSRKAARDQQAQVRKAQKQSNDSVRAAERRADKKKYLDQVKAIVGPDNYVIFLENMYINGGGQHKGGKAMGPGKDFKQGKGDMKGPKGPRGDRKGPRGDKRPAPQAN